MASTVCRLCAVGLDQHVRGPRDVAALRELPRPRTSWTSRRRSTRSTCGSAAVPARPAAGLHPGRGHLQRTTPTSPRTATRGWRTPSATSRRRSSGSGSAASPSSWRWPATTATCCSTRSRAASARSASSRPRTSPRPRAARGVPTEVRVPRRGDGAEVAAGARPGRPRGRQQRLRPRARHRGLHARACARWSPTTGTVTHRDPAPAAAHRAAASTTPSTTSTTRYLSLLTTQRVLARPGCRWSTSRSCPPTAARCGLVHARRVARPSRVPAVKAVLAAEAAAGLHTVDGHAGFARRSSQVRNDLLDFLLDASARASGWSPTARRARATPCSTTAASARTWSRTASTATRYKHGRFLPGDPHPDPPGGGARGPPDFVLVMPWNLRAEISAQLGVRPGVGWAARRRPARARDLLGPREESA